MVRTSFNVRVRFRVMISTKTRVRIANGALSVSDTARGRSQIIINTSQCKLLGHKISYKLKSAKLSSCKQQRPSKHQSFTHYEFVANLQRIPQFILRLSYIFSVSNGRPSQRVMDRVVVRFYLYSL